VAPDLVQFDLEEILRRTNILPDRLAHDRPQVQNTFVSVIEHYMQDAKHHRLNTDDKREPRFAFPGSVHCHRR
jgi:hypothetical protein